MSGLPAKVSLIVPVYNIERYLGLCLESCREQTLNDLEIICVDDGSTDNSGEMLEHFKKLDTRFTVIHKKNGGLSSARNAGINAAKGEWLMFLDGDDYLSPNACERVWEEAQEEPTDIIVFGTDYFPTYPTPKDANWLNSTLHPRTVRFYEFKPDLLFEEPGGSPYACRQAFSSALLNKYHVRFNEDLKFGEDMLFQLQFFPRAERFSFIADTLYHYRLGRIGSLMDAAEKNMENKLRWHVTILDYGLKEWSEQGLLENYAVDILNWAVDFVVNNLYVSKIADKRGIMELFYQVIDKYHMETALEKVTMDRKNILINMKQHN